MLVEERMRPGKLILGMVWGGVALVWRSQLVCEKYTVCTARSRRRC